MLTAAGEAWYGDPDVHPSTGPGAGAWWSPSARTTARPSVAEHGEAVTTIVAVPLDGSAADDLDAVTVLVAGADFCSTPQLSADGRLAWTQWDHPNMPWDSTTVRVAPLGPDGLGAVETVAGGPGESAVQPRWHGDELVFASDRTGWWNLYAWSAATGPSVRALYAAESEFAEPQWVLGMSPYAVAPGDGPGRLVCLTHRPTAHPVSSCSTSTAAG